MNLSNTLGVCLFAGCFLAACGSSDTTESTVTGQGGSGAEAGTGGSGGQGKGGAPANGGSGGTSKGGASGTGGTSGAGGASGGSGGSGGSAGSSGGSAGTGGNAGSGACEPGSCGIELVADLSSSTLYTPQIMVVDDTNVYFAHVLSSKVHRVPKSGGTYELVSDLGDDVLELAQHGDSLYPFVYTGSTIELYQLPKAGGSTTLIHQASGSNIDVGEVVPEASGTVYFGAGQNAGGVANAYRWEPSTATKTQLYGASRFIRTNDTHLFFWSGSSIMRATKDIGAVPEKLVMAGTAVHAFEVDGDELFYSYSDRVSVYRVALNAPFQETELTTSDVQADFVYEDFYVDASYVYVMADTNDVSIIYRIPRGGGDAQPWVEDQASGRGMAQDADYIYWSAMYSGGKKMIVRKHK